MGYSASELKFLTPILEENVEKSEAELIRIALKKLAK